MSDEAFKVPLGVMLPPGVMSGVGVVRDKDGNVKGEKPEEKHSGDDSDKRSRERGG